MTRKTLLVAASLLTLGLGVVGTAALAQPHHGGPDLAQLSTILTPEQRKALEDARQGKDPRDMTREERRAFAEKRREIMAGLTAEQKDKLRTLYESERGSRFADLRASIDSVLTAEQKAKLDAAAKGKAPRDMTAEERRAFGQARREVFQSLTDTQRDKLRALMPRHRQDGDHRGGDHRGSHGGGPRHG